MPAKVVVIGSGGREHALVRALRRGSEAREIVAVPGNPGIAREARCMPAQPSLADAALAESPDLVVVGPEAPLAEGFADRMAERGVPCFGPSQAAARIESSKAFAKEIMLAAGVPTPGAEVFDDPEKARQHAGAQGACVVKLDGLAAGKGVIVADDGAQAARAVEELWRPGARLLIEERLEGREISVIALCDGEHLVPLPPARDHKRLLEGDLGPNTGGMGAVCPPADATQELIDLTVRTVLAPTARELARRGTPFVGALYAGLMLTSKGPRVLEFNCRLGDPEAQAILVKLRSDPLPLFFAAAQGKLAGQKPAWDARTAVAVVLAAHGYPGAPRAMDEIHGLEAVAADEGDDLWVLHAGTRLQSGKVVTAGGRVLTVVALGSGPAQARARAYGAAARITFAGMQSRSDIAAAES
ncbi:MAG TPA: phosphoribosylamine--glycine ligase [Myxococcales bacterium]|nr:phosphoribosylamine--glycine ligase [Myxococcales bacterium]